MRYFRCNVCEQPVFFENARCFNCDNPLGYLPELAIMSAFKDKEGDSWRSLGPPTRDQDFKPCSNREQAAACNWMIAAAEDDTLCLSCRLNQTIPDLGFSINQERWRRLETAKRRLIYGLLALKLPIAGKDKDEEGGLAFAFLSDPEAGEEDTGRVLTGHFKGLITINAAEADAVVREKVRRYMRERYRTVLGHFRHEIGHYYWDHLVKPSTWLEPFRALFGDEREDYQAALQRYHDQGTVADWQTRFISAYASAHAWEDWAETWAHYMHMADTVETARAFGFKAVFEAPIPASQASRDSPDPVACAFAELLRCWLPLTVAINGINRSMGVEDPYPFVLSTPVVDKLLFVHRVIHTPQG